ncbi:MAG: hypothetical protein ACSHWS_14830 [Sulfitobacter sp.]
MLDRTQAPNTAIDRLLQKFIAGDPSMFDDIAADIDFAIEHYRDADGADVTWQRAKTLQDMITLVGRLGAEVFPQGTKALDIETTALGNGWHMTRFNQRFHYAVRDRMVESVTYITSHEAGGKLDFFREVVTTVDNI